jgi:hypothetical protein
MALAGCVSYRSGPQADDTAMEGKSTGHNATPGFTPWSQQALHRSSASHHLSVSVLLHRDKGDGAD